MKKSGRYHPESTRHNVNKNPQMTKRFEFTGNEEESRSRELYDEEDSHLTDNLIIETKSRQPQIEIEENEM